MKVSHRPVRFGGHWHCGGGEIIVLVCHVIFQDQEIKAFCDFMDESSSCYVTNLPSFLTISIVVEEI